jgi:hypothetical protein
MTPYFPLIVYGAAMSPTRARSALALGALVAPAVVDRPGLFSCQQS